VVEGGEGGVMVRKWKWRAGTANRHFPGKEPLEELGGKQRLRSYRHRLVAAQARNSKSRRPGH